ncbi:MAG: universal stress protein [Desulfobacterales bacterium]
MEKDREIRWNKNFLVAVDDSDNSRRAVQYVGYLLGRMPEVHVTLLHVIPEPDEDYFPEAEQRQQWLATYRKKMEAVLDDYRRLLLDEGFPEKAVEMRLPLRWCPSMAECILSERDERRYGTIVVGRQGLSRKEQFLFGSISSKIVNHARYCTVWVVE